MSADQDLDRAVGRVALADAQVDEWLQQVLVALLSPMAPDVVRILTSPDNAVGKITKIRRLADRLGRLTTVPPGHEDDVSTRLTAIRKDKEERDLAMHSVYDTRSVDELRRFRSRSPEPNVVTTQSIAQLADRLESHASYLEAYVRFLETPPTENDVESGALDDARELLLATRLRLTDDQIQDLRGVETPRLAMRGMGQWRLLSTGEQASPDEIEAILDPSNGRIVCTRSDGSTFEGGDTGWRDVSNLARQADPSIQKAHIRRIHGQVLIKQEGGTDLHAALDRFEESGLLGRIFGATSDEPAISLDWVPEGFRPNASDPPRDA